MSPRNTNATPRAIVDELFGRQITREIWTANYEKVLPITIQDFDLPAVLPAVFYMFRFGQRRGRGRFLEVFGPDTGTPRERRRAAHIERVATTLAESDAFSGFEDPVAQSILGDLLLCFCLENAKRALGRKEQLQRVAPAHYMASWIDLPESVAHLRHVPEMIVAMLANQKGDYVEQTREDDLTRFAVGGFERNVLLHPFHQGVTRRGELGSRTSDRFAEETPVGLDQLLMIRLAQQLGSAPDKLRVKEGERIPNQRPIAERAARDFSEDIRRFVKSYSAAAPRHAFVDLLESCMAIGMTAILTSVIEILFDWEKAGRVPRSSEQKPTHMFVDCSNGVDRHLRQAAEQSLDDFMRRLEHVPFILMALRLLDRGARYDPKIKAERISTKPHAIEWLNLLGDLVHERRAEAGPILYNLSTKAEELAEKLEDDYSEAAHLLKNSAGQPNPVWRLAESLTGLQGRKNTHSNFITLLDSILLTGKPNGLAAKRTVTRSLAAEGVRRRREVRSLVFTDSALDYLVHLHVLGYGQGVRAISFKSFIQKLHRRYGLCIDVSPPGITISNSLLQKNRTVLERRLRDLGLFVGVNDAEAMKRLTPRFEPASEGESAVD